MNRLVAAKIFVAGIFSIMGNGLLAQGDGNKIRICNSSVIEEFCQDENLGSSDFSVQPALNRCMNEMFVCRRYGELANKLLAAINSGQGSLPPLQEYFLGSAIMRLQLTTRSEGTRCELSRRAKEHLGSFLITSKLKFQESGGFGSIGLRYIRDAVNSLEILNRPNSCPEAAPSRQLLVTEATQYAFETAENLFRNVKIDDPFQSGGASTDPIQSRMSEIFVALQGFTSKASELEIGSKMIETELAGNEARLDQIIRTLSTEVYTQADGNVGVGPDGQLDLPSQSSKVTLARQTATQMETAAGEMVAAKDQAVDKISQLLGQSQAGADSYNSLRIKYSSLAYSWAAEAAFQDQVANLLSSKGSLNQLFTKVSSATAVDSPAVAYQSVKAAYYEKYKAVCGTLAGRGRWYCKS